jgi:hypothetical protein
VLSQLSKSVNGWQTAREFAAYETNLVRRLDLRQRPLNVSVQISVRTVSAGVILRKSLFLLVGRLATELAV